MLRTVVFVTCCAVLMVNAKECERCETEKTDTPVCGADGNTYPSFCQLLRAECLQEKMIGFDCDGKCPCDPSEVKKFDEQTVKKLSELRRDIQLEHHIPDLEKMEIENNSDDMMTLEIMDKETQEIIEQTTGDVERCSQPKLIGNCRGYFKNYYYDNERQTCVPFVYGGCGGNDNRFNTVEECMDTCHSPGCPDHERRNLPSRLIDWFHVLRANEIEKENKLKGNHQQPVLKEINFVDGKLKAMYSRLACADNDDEVEKEVCLPPVRWMFGDLDKDNDQVLSAVELLAIEEVNNEHCIKPFLTSCDRNKDKKVVLKEFCRCLCHTPPCTHLLESIPTVVINGLARPMPGKFTPKCDEDGFFMPRQVNILKEQHWCVDRNGAEFQGTRKNISEAIECSLNTRSHVTHGTRIPLNVQQEDEIDKP